MVLQQDGMTRFTKNCIRNHQKVRMEYFLKVDEKDLEKLGPSQNDSSFLLQKLNLAKKNNLSVI